MRNKEEITPATGAMNTVFGNNLRYIRNRRKLTLQKTSFYGWC